MPEELRDPTRMPLFPLPNLVHFPRTDLKLHVFEPRHRRLVRDLIELEEEARWVGVVLLKPGWREAAGNRPEVFPDGTAGRLIDVEFLPDGRSNIVLSGEYRFELSHELGDLPYRQAVVRPVAEPWLSETDAGVVAVRSALLELLRSLAAELGESFPFDLDDAEELSGRCRFEELVNRVAAGLDLPPLRKMQLLHQALPERGVAVLSILRNRQQVVDLLRPFRHLAEGSQHN